MAELKKKIHALKPKFYPSRQRLTLPPKAGAKSGEALRDSATIESLGLKDGAVVHFKDLGTQVRCAVAAARGATALGRAEGARRRAAVRPPHSAALANRPQPQLHPSTRPPHTTPRV